MKPCIAPWLQENILWWHVLLHDSRRIFYEAMYCSMTPGEYCLMAYIAPCLQENILWCHVLLHVSRRIFYDATYCSMSPGEYSMMACIAPWLQENILWSHVLLHDSRKIFYDGMYCSMTPGDLLENYCQSDDLMTAGRFLFAFTIMLTYPIECFVTREVRLHCLIWLLTAGSHIVQI